MNNHEIMDNCNTWGNQIIKKALEYANYKWTAIKELELLFGSDVKGNIIGAVASCLICGFVWFLLEGNNRTFHNFLEGFFFPFTCIIVYSVFGLPERILY